MHLQKQCDINRSRSADSISLAPCFCLCRWRIYYKRHAIDRNRWPGWWSLQVACFRFCVASAQEAINAWWRLHVSLHAVVPATRVSLTMAAGALILFCCLLLTLQNFKNNKENKDQSVTAKWPDLKFTSPVPSYKINEVRKMGRHSGCLVNLSQAKKWARQEIGRPPMAR